MKKNKLQRFAELGAFPNVIQPKFEEGRFFNFPQKGNWASAFFKNEGEIVIEAGCGKGEYTVGLAQAEAHKNFVGIDIKGDRIWVGAKQAYVQNIGNAAFLRTWVDYLDSFFAPNEVSEIWLTFPDPQIQKLKKRLTSARFLTLYQKILKPGGIVHLKTDSQLLHRFTLDSIQVNELELLAQTTDLYQSEILKDLPPVKTFYERNYLMRGLPITYLSFRFPDQKKVLINPDEDLELHEKEVLERRITGTNQIIRGQIIQ